MNLAQFTLIGAVRIYRGIISPVLTAVFTPLGFGCRFHPTCSQYAADAIRTHGACKGTWLARQRDPSVTMESVPDVYTVQYGGNGGKGALSGVIPPNEQELLLPYRELKL